MSITLDLNALLVHGLNMIFLMWVKGKTYF